MRHYHQLDVAIPQRVCSSHLFSLAFNFASFFAFLNAFLRAFSSSSACNANDLSFNLLLVVEGGMLRGSASMGGAEHKLTSTPNSCRWYTQLHI